MFGAGQQQYERHSQQRGGDFALPCLDEYIVETATPSPGWYVLLQKLEIRHGLCVSEIAEHSSKLTPLVFASCVLRVASDLDRIYSAGRVCMFCAACCFLDEENDGDDDDDNDDNNKQLVTFIISLDRACLRAGMLAVVATKTSTAQQPHTNNLS